MSERDLRVERVRRSSDNSEISPADLLRAVLADIEDGTEEITSIIVIGYDENNKTDNLTVWRAKVKQFQELALLELAKDSLLARIRGRGR